MDNIIKNDVDIFLLNSEIGQTLDPNELKMILSHNKLVSFEPGNVILKQGTPSDGIYMIVRGNVFVRAKLLGEGFTNIETLEPGNFIGEISYIEKVPSTTSVIAKNLVQCLFLNDVYFQLITNYFPETKYKILNIITKQACDRLKKIHQKIIDVITKSDMITRSFFSEVMQSLTRPEEITLADAFIKPQDIERLPSFNSFSQSDVSLLLKHAIPMMAPKNCTLISKGEPNNSCYIVIHGAVQSSIIQNNKIAKLSIIGPVTLFTWPPYIEAESSFTVTFSTCEKALLLMLNTKALEFIQKEHPSLWYKLFDLICLSVLALEKSVDKLDVRLQIEIYNR